MVNFVSASVLYVYVRLLPPDNGESFGPDSQKPCAVKVTNCERGIIPAAAAPLKPSHTSPSAGLAPRPLTDIHARADSQLYRLQMADGGEPVSSSDLYPSIGGSSCGGAGGAVSSKP